MTSHFVNNCVDLSLDFFWMAFKDNKFTRSGVQYFKYLLTFQGQEKFYAMTLKISSFISQSWSAS